MKILRLVLSIMLLSLLSLYAQESSIPVFTSGTEGYNTFRIPAIIKTPAGDLLAFCEGRVKNAGDFGNVDIVMKRSSDNGVTWSELTKIMDADSLQAGNSAPVVDLTDPEFPGGRIFLFFNTGNNHEGEVRKGNGLREVWYTTSTDNGASWSEKNNITAQVHRPKAPKYNLLYNFDDDWRAYANTPGHALQILSGKYRGRIYVPANHSEGDPDKHFRDYYAHGFYTDDHGKSFELSKTVPIPGSNESTAAELTGGKLMLNSRNQSGDIKTRIISISSNGGESWDSTFFDMNLPDPVCEGTLLNIGEEKGNQVLAFCNPADKNNRDNLTLRISYDEGKTWKHSFLIDSSSEYFKGDYTAYSDIVKLSDSVIGILYEKDNYSKIVFTKLKWR